VCRELWENRPGVIVLLGIGLVIFLFLVVDAWRQITVQANSLLGVANVAYHLDSATPLIGTNPFAFSGSRTRNQLILDFEAPLVRKEMLVRQALPVLLGILVPHRPRRTNHHWVSCHAIGSKRSSTASSDWLYIERL